MQLSHLGCICPRSVAGINTGDPFPLHPGADLGCSIVLKEGVSEGILYGGRRQASESGLEVGG